MKKDTQIEQIKELTPIQGEAEVLIAQAIEKNVPVESLERLLAMRRELKAEKAKEEFDHAMASFQMECPTIQKRKKVSFGGGGYSYAPLEDIVAQVRELLSKNGFSYTFDTKKTEKSLTTYCKVKHIGGHSEISEFEIAIDTSSHMNISQKDGAASSYGKRYAFCNAFGILTGDEDTDSHVPTNTTQYKFSEKPAQISKPVNQLTETITQDQKTEILDILQKKGKSRLELDALLYEAYGKSIDTITKKQAYDVIAKLQKTPTTPKVTEEDMDKIDDII